MNVRYLSTLTIVSLLTLGGVAACSNPCAAKSPSSNAGTELPSDPCAGKNPCAAKADPCAGKNPCAAKADPCAGKNPCAAKAQSLSAPLAPELQGKPVVVDIYASWCSACENIAPTLSQLKDDYAGKVHFVVLDMSDRTTTAEAEAKAQELGLGDFLATHKSQTGMLTIVNPDTGEILAQHRNNPTLSDYTTVLDTALAQ
ncbi:thioredoxin family protein [Spirulina subsalsa FACHB-351]|uniref:Thioredoxin family protein n=1 Tax=Spirulina subsalsa FACHB-351 TaxID=234711 RepID=A0ABT3L804_9CYAN|nr:thioredoxin family protein [Spirulina subsalsa]MCW6037648.1 thioredoxin family protein [Spirulina subsalsa FACHB-351]